MKTSVDARLRQESARFAFRFACEDCAHAQPTPAPSPLRCKNVAVKPVMRCSLGYPAGPLRQALREAAFELCKEFELGPL